MTYVEIVLNKDLNRIYEVGESVGRLKALGVPDWTLAPIDSWVKAEAKIITRSAINHTEEHAEQEQS